MLIFPYNLIGTCFLKQGCSNIILLHYFILLQAPSSKSGDIWKCMHIYLFYESFTCNFINLCIDIVKPEKNFR